MEFGRNSGHLHPVRRTKAIEKEIVKIRFAKFPNNLRVCISATNKHQQDRILKIETLQDVNYNPLTEGGNVEKDSLCRCSLRTRFLKRSKWVGSITEYVIRCFKCQRMGHVAKHCATVNKDVLNVEVNITMVNLQEMLN